MVLRRFSFSWRLVLLAGLLANLAVMVGVSIGLAVALTVRLAVGPVPSTPQAHAQLISRISARLAPWLGMGLSVVTTALVGGWVARRVSMNRPYWHAFLAGFWSGLLGTGMGAVFGGQVRLLSPGILLQQGVLYGLIGLAGAWLGLRTYRDPEALARATEALRRAASPEEALAVVWSHLARPGLMLVLARVERHPQEGTVVRAEPLAWMPRDAPLPGRGWTVDEAPWWRHVNGREAVYLKVSRLPPKELGPWAETGVVYMVALPLHAEEPPATFSHLLLVLSFRPRGLPRGWMRDARTLAPALSLSLQNLRLLEQVRQAAVLEERQRLARDLHDTLAQAFVSIMMNLDAALGHLESRPEQAAFHLHQAREAARAGLEEARRMVWALRPRPLEEGSLVQALRTWARNWSRNTGVALRFAVSGRPVPLPPEMEEALLRVMQEALTNVAKHARAHQVQVTLSFLDGEVLLDVADDGVGFDLAAAQHRGYGLASMQERMRAVGGTLEIESEPGHGTTVTARVWI